MSVEVKLVLNLFGTRFGALLKSDGTPFALPCAVIVKYRLVRRIVGMYHDDSPPIMIPPGAVVEISPTRSKVGIISASYDGRMIWVFLHDLLDAGRIEQDTRIG
jgi:hypothetical protein